MTEFLMHVGRYKRLLSLTQMDFSAASCQAKKYALKFLTFFLIKQPKSVLPRKAAYFRSIFSNVVEFYCLTVFSDACR